MPQQVHNFSPWAIICSQYIFYIWFFTTFEFWVQKTEQSSRHGKCSDKNREPHKFWLFFSPWNHFNTGYI